MHCHYATPASCDADILSDSRQQIKLSVGAQICYSSPTMPDWPEKLLLAFIPLFVAIDPIGVVPLFLGISQGIAADRKRRIVNQATWTAAIVAIGFMFLGKLIFRALNITVADFQVAGGLILLALSAHDLTGRGPNLSE